MALGTFLQVVTIGTALGGLKSPFKYYCRFSDALQSVCFRTLENEGLYGISLHNVFVYGDEPRVPYYESTSWSAQRNEHPLKAKGRGQWTLQHTEKFPWPAENPIMFEKVDLHSSAPHSGYIDVNFTDRDEPKRFSRIMPISIHDIPLRGRVPIAEFGTNSPRKLTAKVQEDPFAPLDAHPHNYLLIEVHERGSTFILEGSSTRLGGRVRVLRGLSSGQVITAEALFFKFPTEDTQYGLMVTLEGKSYMLYRKGEEMLRNHDKLPES